jgi:hypothetical protein
MNIGCFLRGARRAETRSTVLLFLFVGYSWPHTRTIRLNYDGFDPIRRNGQSWAVCGPTMPAIFISSNRPPASVVTAIHLHITVCVGSLPPRSKMVVHQMSIRTTRKMVKFTNPFSLVGVGRVLPPGVYEVMTDEELIERLSFPVYRRAATMILAPTQSSQPSIEMLTIDPQDLATAMTRDTLAVKGASVSAKLT